MIFCWGEAEDPSVRMECCCCGDEDPSTLDSVVTRIMVLGELAIGFFGKPIVVEGLRGIPPRT